MSVIMRWKMTLSLALATGILCFSAYGVCNTVWAFNNIEQAQTSDTTLALPSALEGEGLLPEGTVCHPLGCAACGGCVALLYQGNVSTLPDSDIRLEQID